VQLPDAAAAFAISDLLVKQLPASAARPATTAPAQAAKAAPADADVLYEVQWQAASSSTAVDAAAVARSPAAAAATAATWRLVTSPGAAAAVLPAGTVLKVDFTSAGERLSSRNGSALALRGLEVLQRLPPGGALALRTRGAFGAVMPGVSQQGNTAHSAAAAAVAAMARVAANELPSAHITYLDVQSSVPQIGSGRSEVSLCLLGLVDESSVDARSNCSHESCSCPENSNVCVLRAALVRSRHCMLSSCMYGP